LLKAVETPEIDITRKWTTNDAYTVWTDIRILTE